ncbi:MAG: VOC family protein [Oscillospiraceae bacterium]|jgi:methylmalonyl-CoA/ethylmalonyl-CoA epimerase|nr:VOC family protein [Oscillospiraceae bacterium]
MTLHHVGYLVADLAAAAEEFFCLGFTAEGDTVADPVREVSILFIRSGGTLVELICPAGKDSPFAPLLKRFKNSPYHFCYEVKSLEETERELLGRGYLPVKPPEHAPALGGRMVAFYVHGDIGILELVEG